MLEPSMSLESSTTCRIILSELYCSSHIHWVFSDVWMEAEHGNLALNADTWSSTCWSPLFILLGFVHCEIHFCLVLLICGYLPSQCTSCIQSWCSTVSFCCKYQFSLYSASLFCHCLLCSAHLWTAGLLFFYDSITRSHDLNIHYACNPSGITLMSCLMPKRARTAQRCSKSRQR